MEGGLKIFPGEGSGDQASFKNPGRGSGVLPPSPRGGGSVGPRNWDNFFSAQSRSQIFYLPAFGRIQRDRGGHQGEAGGGRTPPTHAPPREGCHRRKKRSLLGIQSLYRTKAALAFDSTMDRATGILRGGPGVRASGMPSQYTASTRRMMLGCAGSGPLLDMGARPHHRLSHIIFFSPPPPEPCTPFLINFCVTPAPCSEWV